MPAHSFRFFQFLGRQPRPDKPHVCRSFGPARQLPLPDKPQPCVLSESLDKNKRTKSSGSPLTGKKDLVCGLCPLE